MKSSFNGQLRKLKNESEVSLGSCWEIGTLSKMKRPSWTSRFLSENASSSLSSTYFTSDFFVAFDGRHLSDSSMREVSEVNVKFVATWLKQWKKNNGENMRQVLLISLYQIWNVQKRKNQPREELSIIFFHFKNGLFTLKKLAMRMKVLVCENNSYGTSSPLMVTDCLAKLFTGLTSQTTCLRKPFKRNKAPDKAIGCLEKLLWIKDWKTKKC